MHEDRKKGRCLVDPQPVWDEWKHLPARLHLALTLEEAATIPLFSAVVLRVIALFLQSTLQRYNYISLIMQSQFTPAGFAHVAALLPMRVTGA